MSIERSKPCISLRPLPARSDPTTIRASSTLVSTWTAATAFSMAGVRSALCQRGRVVKEVDNKIKSQCEQS